MKILAVSSTPVLSPDIKAFLLRFACVALICVVLSALSDNFLTVANILNILRQASLIFFIALGLTLVIIAGGLDLSVGANVGLSACLAASVLQMTGSSLAAISTALACGALIGVINGLLVVTLRLPPFIATYGMLWVLHGLTYYFMAGTTIYGFPAGFRFVGSGYVLGIPFPIFLMAAFFALGVFISRGSIFGQELYLIGSNPKAARLSGIPVNKRLSLVYALSGAMAGLAAIVYLARLNSADADIGETLLLPALAAVLIGGTSLFGGVGSIAGTLVGSLILTLVLNGMNLLVIDANWQPLVTGVITLVAVLIDVTTRSRAEQYVLRGERTSPPLLEQMAAFVQIKRGKL